MTSPFTGKVAQRYKAELEKEGLKPFLGKGKLVKEH